MTSLDPSGELRAVVSDCVHCGFCLPACPTYQLWGEEMDSPRGRIHLIAQLLDGAQASDTAAAHIDRCLGCMACVPACPSGVRYDRLIEAARSWTEEPQPGPQPLPARSARDRVVRAAIFSTFPYPRRLRVLLAPLRAAQRTGLDRAVRRPAVARRLPAELAAALRLAPGRRGRGAPAGRRLPGRVAARGTRRAVVGMLTGCVQQVFFPQVNAATARVLAAEGCDVVIPADQACCGALSLHGGRREEAARFARRAIEVFDRAGVDAIVVNSAGCGSAMKEYADLLAGDPQWAARAAALSSRVRDFSEFLAGLGPAAERHPLPVTIAYHDACHLAHAQRVSAQPRELLSAIPGLRLSEIPDPGTCCGSAGIYNLVQPGPARELGERKAEAVRQAGAELLVSANPGCTMQISAALAERGQPMPVAHIAEVLDASLLARPAAALLTPP
jgi:glycolate oxidase iron-sulfur subunit